MRTSTDANPFGRLAGNIGKGLAAGFVGTAAMTVSSTLEAKIRDRGSSSTPAEAAEKMLGVEEMDSEQAESRFNNLVHWGYGTAWGAARGLLGSVLPPAAADAAHLGAVWGGEQVVLPSLDVSPPATQWGAKEVGIDVLHHVVYALATGLAYRWLDR